MRQTEKALALGRHAIKPLSETLKSAVCRVRYTPTLPATGCDGPVSTPVLGWTGPVFSSHKRPLVSQ